MKVEWEGTDEDGEAWDHEWKRIAELTTDLRREARAMHARMQTGVKPRWRAPAQRAIERKGWRKSPRLLAQPELERQQREQRVAHAWEQLRLLAGKRPRRR